MARITIKEFFSLREMFMGLGEDFELAFENYKNLDFDDRDIVDLLFTKSLLFDKRIRFLRAIDKGYLPEELISKNINLTIKNIGDYVVYKKILEYYTHKHDKYTRWCVKNHQNFNFR